MCTNIEMNIHNPYNVCVLCCARVVRIAANHSHYLFIYVRSHFSDHTSVFIFTIPLSSVYLRIGTGRLRKQMWYEVPQYWSECGPSGWRPRMECWSVCWGRPQLVCWFCPAFDFDTHYINIFTYSLDDRRIREERQFIWCSCLLCQHMENYPSTRILSLSLPFFFCLH